MALALWRDRPIAVSKTAVKHSVIDSIQFGIVLTCGDTIIS